MFGDRLKELRKNKNMKQEELGNLLGDIKANTISNWETGVSQPSIEYICSIANIFGVSIDYLFGIENDQKEIDMLRKALIEAGFEVNNDLSMEDLKKALEIVNVMKDTK